MKNCELLRRLSLIGMVAFFASAGAFPALSQGTGKIYFLMAGLHGVVKVDGDDRPVKASGAVKVMNADGSGETTLVTGNAVNEPDGIEIDAVGRKMYWTNMGPGGSLGQSVAINDGTIMRANLDGTNVETIVRLGVTTTPKQIALDVVGGKVYWCDRGDVNDNKVKPNPKVMRANLNGSDVEAIITTDLQSPVGIALDVPNGKVYFTDRKANNIKRANMDGSDIEIVVQNTISPIDLALDLKNRKIFWTSRKKRQVLRADMDANGTDGSTLKPIVDENLSMPIGMGIDRENEKIYYTDVLISVNKRSGEIEVSGAIWSSDLDGENAQKIATTPAPLGLFYSAE